MNNTTKTYSEASNTNYNSDNCKNSSGNKRKHNEFSQHGKENVVKFCERHGIEYIPIALTIFTKIDENGKKTKTKALEKDFLGCRPKQTDFDEKPDLVKRRVSRFKNYPREYTHVAMQTFITEFFLYIYI
jgi:hypothetical protein